MNATDTLNRVKAVLGLEVSLEQMKLENGTTIEAEKFEDGASVFIVTEDEKVALPVGEYELEDEKILVVVEEGVIAEIKEGGEEEEQEIEEEMEEEKQEMEYVSKEELASALEEIKAMIEEVKAGYVKEEMSEEVVEEAEETVEEIAEELSEVEETTEEEELKEELSKPATEPLKHSPEKEVKAEGFQFSKNRQMTTLDRVMQKITNFK